MMRCNEASSKGNEEKVREKCLENRNQAVLKDLRCKTLRRTRTERFREVCKNCQNRKPGTGMGYHGITPEQVEGKVS